jgi:hypothetical protein
LTAQFWINPRTTTLVLNCGWNGKGGS